MMTMDIVESAMKARSDNWSPQCYDSKSKPTIREGRKKEQAQGRNDTGGVEVA
jgi:hypothetical protein